MLTLARRLPGRRLSAEMGRASKSEIEDLLSVLAHRFPIQLRINIVLVVLEFVMARVLAADREEEEENEQLAFKASPKSPARALGLAEIQE